MNNETPQTPDSTSNVSPASDSSLENSPPVSGPPAADLRPTETPARSSAPSPSGGKRSPLLLVLVGVLLLALLGSAFMAYKYMTEAKDVKAEADALQAKVSEYEQTTHDIPAGAVKVSDCIPNMGFHYIAQGADPEYGPFLLVNKANKVIGIEYMAAPDMYTKIPNLNPPISVLMKDSPMFGWRYDHTEFSSAPEGHEGLVRDHVDVHYYTVTAEEQKQACL